MLIQERCVLYCVPLHPLPSKLSIWITREGRIEEGEVIERNLNGRGRRGAAKGEKGMEREKGMGRGKG